MRERCTDELLYHMPTVASRGEGWAKTFAASILKQSRRRRWEPSAKQRVLMQALVDGLFEADEPDLFEEECREGSAPTA